MVADDGVLAAQAQMGAGGMNVTYRSTRGRAPDVDFEGVLLSGLARDGGLYVPVKWPQFDGAAIRAMRGQSYERIACRVLEPFVGSGFDAAELGTLVESAYAGFASPERCPLAELDQGLFLLELHHGPTLAFKDFALSLVARMFNAVLASRGERVVILGATSGDTGSAAIDAFRGLPAVEVVILYPEGRVSEIQRRQMTTPEERNVHAVPVQGDFDVCQAIVKSLFNDLPFRDRHRLAAVNSINWARIVAQMAYYFAAVVRLDAFERKVSFVVPTGNFGDIYAGYAARQCGLPIEALHIATNRNDILCRVLATGSYCPDAVHATMSPSMDIQVSSNFERALFAACGEDGERVRGLMARLADGGFALDGAEVASLREDFQAGRCGEDETLSEIAGVWRERGVMLCPHSAVGVHVARRVAGDGPVVALATAHPAKFPEAVGAACGETPAIPDRLQTVLDRNERSVPCMAGLEDVRRFIEELKAQ
ncbi:MAG: threonine synthase [Rhodobacteraceae bacterium]|nr:threonine synthase [Paracoccaceae bacterium]